MSRKNVHTCDYCGATTENRQKHAGWIFLEAPGREEIFITLSTGSHPTGGRIQGTDFCSITCLTDALDGAVEVLRILKQPPSKESQTTKSKGSQTTKRGS